MADRFLRINSRDFFCSFIHYDIEAVIVTKDPVVKLTGDVTYVASTPAVVKESTRQLQKTPPLSRVKIYGGVNPALAVRLPSVLPQDRSLTVLNRSKDGTTLVCFENRFPSAVRRLPQGQLQLMV